MKYLAFDIEIVKEIPEGEDWKEHRPLGISCAATIRTDDTSPIHWYSGQRIKTPLNRPMNTRELRSLISYLFEQSRNGFNILTWNGLGFDFQVLAEESGDFPACSEIAYNHIDMMFHFLCKKGYPLGLQAASLGMGLTGKMEGFHGELAPPMWTNNNERLIELGQPEFAKLSKTEKRDLVILYVGQDVMTTLDLAQIVDKKKHIAWTSRSGKPQSVAFPNGWYPVNKAIKIKTPNTSWRDNPLKREDLLEWTQK